MKLLRYGNKLYLKQLFNQMQKKITSVVYLMYQNTMLLAWAVA